ncbi:MAG: prepilin-type N-terminal cleavage/methylation domain-containing protein [Legionella sp.]|uniref:GspH/FimT family pseudopilin n=1 Tax=Legionella sp. TaxID=459 RepID=UPI0039E6AC72
MKNKGFTLLELVITMTLLILLTTLSIASYSYLVRNNEQQTIIDELSSAVQYAKMQALILGKSVILQPVDDSLDWSHGLLLTTWSSKQHQSEILHQWQWYHPQWQLTWIGAHSDNKILFSDNPMHAISNGHFNLMNISTAKNKIIILNRLGRIRVSNRLF